MNASPTPDVTEAPKTETKPTTKDTQIRGKGARTVDAEEPKPLRLQLKDKRAELNSFKWEYDTALAKCNQAREEQVGKLFGAHQTQIQGLRKAKEEKQVVLSNEYQAEVTRLQNEFDDDVANLKAALADKIKELKSAKEGKNLQLTQKLNSDIVPLSQTYTKELDKIDKAFMEEKATIVKAGAKGLEELQAELQALEAQVKDLDAKEEAARKAKAEAAAAKQAESHG